MSINTSFELFSLTDLFRVIESGKKSGRLTIKLSKEAKTSNSQNTYYIWFQNGCLVAVSDRLNHRGLISIIEVRGWLDKSVTSKLRTFCPLRVPLGTYLQKSKLLTPEQVCLIFEIQLHQVFQLFEQTSGSFKFDEMSELKDRIMTIPWLEMTGNYLKATEVSMYALRLIKDWGQFADRLPAPNLIFKRIVSQCQIKLMSLEQQIWQQIDGLNSLNTIAKQLNKSVQSVQIAAFRLLAVGIIEEIILPSLTLETIELNSSTNNLKELNVATETSNPESKEQIQLNSNNQEQLNQTKQDFQPKKEISIADFPPRSIRDGQTLSETTQLNAKSSLLDNLLGLWRRQFYKP